MLAGVLSALVPGAGQLYVRRRVAGAIYLALTLAALGTGLWFLSRGRLYLLKLSVQPRWLELLALAMVVTWSLRVIAALHAVWVSLPERNRVGFSEVTSVMIVVVVLAALALPHALGIRYALLQHDLITTVFADEEPVTVTAEPPPEVEPNLDPPTPLPPGELPSAAPEEPDAPTPTPTPTPAPPRIWDGLERLNVVLLGSDAGYLRSGVRTDAIVVASIEPESGHVALFSIPRNLQHMRFTGGPAAEAFPDGPGDLANTIYQFGLWHPELFPDVTDPGAQAVKSAVAELLGIPIHYYVLVDLDGLVEIVDALGGVTLTVTEHIDDELLPLERGGESLIIQVDPGVHHLDGRQTLAYGPVSVDLV